MSRRSSRGGRASVAQLLNMMPDQLYPFAWGSWGANSQAYGYQAPGSLPMDARPALCPQPAPTCYTVPYCEKNPPESHSPPPNNSPPESHLPPVLPPYDQPPQMGPPTNLPPYIDHTGPGIDDLFTPGYSDARVSGTSDQPNSGYPASATQMPVDGVRLDSGNLATSGAMGKVPWRAEDFAVPPSAVEAGKTAVAALLANTNLANTNLSQASQRVERGPVHEIPVFPPSHPQNSPQNSPHQNLRSQSFRDQGGPHLDITPAFGSAPQPPPEKPKPIATPSGSVTPEVQPHPYAATIEACRKWGYERGRDDRKKGRKFDRDAVSHYGTAGITGGALQPCVTALMAAYNEGWSSVGPSASFASATSVSGGHPFAPAYGSGVLGAGAEVHPFARVDNALVRMMNYLPQRGRRY